MYDTEDLSMTLLSENVTSNTMERFRRTRKALVYLSVTFLFVVSCGGLYIHKKSVQHHEEVAELNNMLEAVCIVEMESLLHSIAGGFAIKPSNSHPNSDTVWKFIQKCKPWYPEIIMAQAQLESGCGTSEIAKKANNLFGMRTIDQNKSTRPTTQIPGMDYNGYGVYTCWEMSVIDRILWELHRNAHKKPEYRKYIDRLSVYAEAEEYLEKVERISKKYSK